MSVIQTIPKKIFIIPYRERPQQMYFFCKYMTMILENETDYEFYFSHQYDERPFNRGAIKNAGFIAIKQKYPNNYENMTFIFNDIDCIPYKKIFNYDTSIGVITHYYGFTHSLGGIVVIKGCDFERINGFPCYWSWGKEDYILQQRCKLSGLIVDRTHFYSIGSPEILQLFDGINRLINKKEIKRSEKDDGIDGINTINNLYYSIDKESKNEKDSNFLIQHEKTFVINIMYFLTQYSFSGLDFCEYDLRKPQKEIFSNNNKKVEEFTNNSWSNISYYHNINEKKINSQVTQVKNKPITPSELYGANYAAKNNIKPKATTSVRIPFGRIYK
jgi:hypothetical protein